MNHPDPAAAQLIEQLELTPHPEGGWYRQTYISKIIIPEAVIGEGRGSRPAATSIYFLLTADGFSAFHRIRSDEIWFHHSGDPVKIEIIHKDGRLESPVIGPADQGLNPQACVPGGSWFASHIPDGGHWALTGCSVAPGFDFRDFELADYSQLAGTYPEHRTIIRSLTRQR